MRPAQKLPTEVAFYDGQVGKRIRIAAEYENTWRPMFWIEIEKDGSLYCNFRLSDPKELRTDTRQIPNGQPIELKYGDGELVNSSLLKSAKVSFHASGVSNSAGLRFGSLNLRELKEQQLLSIFAFRHPREFTPIAQVRKYDACIRYPFDEARPMQGHLYVSPENRFRPELVQGALNQVILVFKFASMLDVPDLAVQLSLSHGVEGIWPPYNVMAFKNIGA